MFSLERNCVEITHTHSWMKLQLQLYIMSGPVYQLNSIEQLSLALLHLHAVSSLSLNNLEATWSLITAEEMKGRSWGTKWVWFTRNQMCVGQDPCVSLRLPAVQEQREDKGLPCCITLCVSFFSLYWGACTDSWASDACTCKPRFYYLLPRKLAPVISQVCCMGRCANGMLLVCTGEIQLNKLIMNIMPFILLRFQHRSVWHDKTQHKVICTQSQPVTKQVDCNWMDLQLDKLAESWNLTADIVYADMTLKTPECLKLAKPRPCAKP